MFAEEGRERNESEVGRNLENKEALVPEVEWGGESNDNWNKILPGA